MVTTYLSIITVYYSILLQLQCIHFCNKDTVQFFVVCIHLKDKWQIYEVNPML